MFARKICVSLNSFTTLSYPHTDAISHRQFFPRGADWRFSREHLVWRAISAISHSQRAVRAIKWLSGSSNLRNPRIKCCSLPKHSRGKLMGDENATAHRLRNRSGHVVRIQCIWCKRFQPEAVFSFINYKIAPMPNMPHRFIALGCVAIGWACSSDHLFRKILRFQCKR